MADSLTVSEVEKKIVELGPWFHNLSLLGIQTAPDHFLGDYPSMKWRNFQHAIPEDLTGKSVLDIGCNGGFYSIEMKRRGAARVLGVDHDSQYLDQARFAAKVLGFDIEFRTLSVYELPSLKERFDLVLFMGVFYHLRHPLARARYSAAVCGQRLARLSIYASREPFNRCRYDEDYPFSETGIFDHPGFPKMHFVEQGYSQDPTNWWIPNRACAEAVLRSSGFKIVDAPEPEVFICRCDENAELHPIPGFGA